MTLLVLLLALISISVLLGYRAGKRAAYREWLLAMLGEMDDVAPDYDAMLVKVLSDIQRRDDVA